jgi:hypothetical protein
VTSAITTPLNVPATTKPAAKSAGKNSRFTGDSV